MSSTKSRRLAMAGIVLDLKLGLQLLSQECGDVLAEPSPGVGDIPKRPGEWRDADAFQPRDGS